MRKIKIQPEIRRPSLATKIVLAMPLVLSFGWIAYLNMQIRNPVIGEEGALFAPPIDNTALMTVLVLFSVGYLCFLLMMFSEDIREFFGRHHQKV